MRVAIVGLPRSGKTTVFNTITGLDAPVGAYGGGPSQPNIGAASIADPRLPELAALFGSKRQVPAAATFVDAPSDGISARASGMFSGEVLNHIQDADALLVVMRAFEDPSNPHPDGSVDAVRDAETVLIELALADANLVRRRVGRIEEGMKGAKQSEREALTQETALLERLAEVLDTGTPISLITLSESESARIRGFQLLTAKPLVLLANTGEDDIDAAHGLTDRISRLDGFLQTETAGLCGKLEMELAQMEAEEEAEFRRSLELGQPASQVVGDKVKNVLNMLTFFTGNEREARAWPIAQGTTALGAAGTIHSDFERGFIRAEVVGFDDFVICGSLSEARHRGLLRQEGRGYVVNDGDVINVLFSV